MSVLADIRLRVRELGERTGAAPDPSEAPLTAEEIDDVQSSLGVQLPPAYVEIVTTIGNGPHGLFFSLFEQDGGWAWDPDSAVEDPKWLRTFLRRPFQHSGRTSVHDHPFFSSDDWLQRTAEAEAEGSEAEDALSEWFEENRNEIIDNDWLDEHFQGSVGMKHYGCAIRDRLIVTGDQAGTIWHSPEGLDFELLPTGLTFDAWVLDLLNRRLAGDAWS